MESANLINTLYVINLMMNVSNGIEEVSSMFEEEPQFLNEEDELEFEELKFDFDYIKEIFNEWENEYINNNYVDFYEIDIIEENVDSMKNYIKNINKLF